MAIGNTQIIGGQSYQMYSPQWYAAQDANKVQQAGVDGKAAGTSAGTAIRSKFEAQFPGWAPPNPGSGYGASNPALQGLMDFANGGYGSSSSSSSSGSSGGSTGGLNTTIPAQASANGPSGAQEDAARSATFARTKDNAANTANASLNGLSEALGARGMTGGGYEAGQIGGTLAREANTIGEGDRQQAESELDHAQHRADEQFQGEIAQRGQDLAAQNAHNQLEMEARQQDLQRRQMSLTALTSALSLSKGAY